MFSPRGTVAIVLAAILALVAPAGAQGPAALRVVKSQSSARLVPGGLQSYRITIENVGSAPISGIVVSDRLDPLLTYRSDTAPASHLVSGELHSWRLGRTLAAGQSMSFRVDARVASALSAGTEVSNTAQVGHFGAQLPIESNTVVARWLPLDDPAPGGVRLDKTVRRRNVRIGSIVGYRIQIANDTGTTLSDLELTDRLPASFAIVPERATRDGRRLDNPRGTSRLVWQLGQLAAGRSTEIEYQVVVGPGARRGNNVNQAVLVGVDGRGIRFEASSRAVVVLGADDLEDPGSIDVVVFEDRDGNGASDGEASGIAGVAVHLSTGRTAKTDAAGECRFDPVPPGSRVVAVDRRTLPAGAELRSASSVMVDLLEGEDARVEFAVTPRLPPDAPFLTLELALNREAATKEAGWR